jgi:hypothetical protein
MTSSTSNTSITPTGSPRRRRDFACAAERRPAYRPTTTGDATARPAGGPTQATQEAHPPAWPSTERAPGLDHAPAGHDGDGHVDVAGAGAGELTARLPVLAELPALADALSDLTAADAALRRAVIALGKLDQALEVEQASGVGLEHWLALACHHTRLERRTLLRTARWTRRLPTFAAALETGALSWAQARTLTLVLRELPAGHDEQADRLLGQLTTTLPDDADPDAIGDQLRRACFRWRDELTPDHDPAPGNRLTIQPRLDGTGGSFHGDADAVGLAILDDATAPRRDQLDHPGGLAGARADNLLTRLLHTCPDHPDEHPAAHGNTDRTGHDDAGHDAHDDAGHDHAGHGSAGHGSAGRGGGLPPVELLARLELDTALDIGRFPLELLTRLLGGRLQLTAAAARRLLDTHGARLRTVLVDNGTVVGVGRTTRIPPGWLTHALLAIHDTCTGPVCDRPARGADADHAEPWWPIDARPGGTTDLDELGPLCAATNRAKETAGWRAEQAPDGLRRWRHPRTGLTTTSIPATWRPPDTTDPPEDPPEDPPDGLDPPHGPHPPGGRHPSEGDHASPDAHGAGPG